MVITGLKLAVFDSTSPDLHERIEGNQEKHLSKQQIIGCKLELAIQPPILLNC